MVPSESQNTKNTKNGEHRGDGDHIEYRADTAPIQVGGHASWTQVGTHLPRENVVCLGQRGVDASAPASSGLADGRRQRRVSAVSSGRYQRRIFIQVPPSQNAPLLHHHENFTESFWCYRYGLVTCAVPSGLLGR